MEFRLERRKSAYLEVRESNTGAIAFYEKQGFAKTGRRKGYYREPDEAAVTMEFENSQARTKFLQVAP